MIFAMPLCLAPLARWAERKAAAGKSFNDTLVALAMILFMLSAYTTDSIGLHAVFGGFLLGCVMPRGVLAENIRQRLEPFTVIVLLPMFFTYSGLNTELTLVADPYLLMVALAVLAMSVFAKFGACWAAARLSGQDNRTALGIGALMNSRGLMELIIINIGLQAGVIGPALFSILVLMAIVTTLMASPVFEVVYGRQARKSGELGALESAG
jgi:Kef-type K+ transport system membrane component KefB